MPGTVKSKGTVLLQEETHRRERVRLCYVQHKQWPVAILASISIVGWPEQATGTSGLSLSLFSTNLRGPGPQPER